MDENLPVLITAKGCGNDWQARAGVRGGPRVAAGQLSPGPVERMALRVDDLRRGQTDIVREAA